MRLIAILLLGFAASAQAPPPPGPPTPINIATGNIEGVVLDGMTGQPLGGAKITPRRVGGQNGAGQTAAPQGTTTDADGHFVLEDVLAGQFRLSARRQGYVSADYGARTPGSPGSVLTLTGEQDLKDIAFRLTPESVISGHVMDEEGKPIRSVIVDALRLRYQSGRRQFIPAGSGSTGAAGEYRITGLAPGRYFVFGRTLPGSQKREAGAHGSKDSRATEAYIPAFYPAEEDELSAGQIDVAIGSELARIDITLRRGEVTPIRGRVVNAGTRDPIVGAVLSVVPTDVSDIGISLRRTATSDEDGSFDIADLRPGSYVVSADSFDGDIRYSDTETITAKNPADDLVLRLVPGLSLKGTIRHDDQHASRAAGPIQIALQSFSDAVLGHLQAKANEDGSFEFKNVVPGRFAVSASGLPDGQYIKAIRYGDRELTSSSITVTGGVALPLEIVVDSSDATASGVVVDSDRNPVPGALVALVPDEPHRNYDYMYRVATTDDAGKFSLRGIAPNVYTAFAWRSPEEAGFRDPMVTKRVERYGVSLDLSQGNAAPIELRLIPPGS